MDELKKLDKILKIEFAIVIIFIIISGVIVLTVFYQFTLRLDAILTQSENIQNVQRLKDLLAQQIEYELQFRISGDEAYAQAFFTIEEEFDVARRNAMETIVLFEPNSSFFYKSNNLGVYQKNLLGNISEIFTHVREGTLEEAEDFIEGHDMLEGLMIDVIDDWQDLNEANLIKLRKEADRFANIGLLTASITVLLVSLIFIFITLKFFIPDIKNLVNDLAFSNKRILSLMKSRTDMINRAAHDLRTPITPILALIPAIKRHIRNKRVLYDINIIEKNANYLKRIANNLIVYLKSRSGKYDYNFVNADIRTVIEEVLATYKEVYDQQGISIKKKFPRNLPLIMVDTLKIAQVFQNIVSNALHFMPKGGKLTVRIKKMHNFINIKFKDTGIGMDKKTLSNIFAEFFKADKSRHSEGQGLGLSICKEVLKNHKGRIRAESKGLGKGSTIVIDIPISQK
jgi:signal transduction histidine kinase|tara:strand:+ start:2932 stop:4299 length:1368 start_codon:yes stop_codon:yes gene_type:complete